MACLAGNKGQWLWTYEIFMAFLAPSSRSWEGSLNVTRGMVSVNKLRGSNELPKAPCGKKFGLKSGSDIWAEFGVGFQCKCFHPRIHTRILFTNMNSSPFTIMQVTLQKNWFTTCLVHQFVFTNISFYVQFLSFANEKVLHILVSFQF